MSKYHFFSIIRITILASVFILMVSISCTDNPLTQRLNIINCEYKYEQVQVRQPDTTGVVSATLQYSDCPYPIGNGTYCGFSPYARMIMFVDSVYNEISTNNLASRKFVLDNYIKIKNTNKNKTILDGFDFSVYLSTGTNPVDTASGAFQAYTDKKLTIEAGDSTIVPIRTIFTGETIANYAGVFKVLFLSLANNLMNTNYLKSPEFQNYVLPTLSALGLDNDIKNALSGNKTPINFRIKGNIFIDLDLGDQSGSFITERTKFPIDIKYTYLPK